ncbi:MAG: prolyl oligopeptidase family serine peptidase [Phycisphaera sp.]|nr:prolyl oligopeptidase family serine peptidase [Phycisphaera sp.]
MTRPSVCLLVALVASAATFTHAADPLPPIKPIARKLPPEGKALDDKTRQALEAELAKVDARIAKAKDDAHLVDAAVLAKAVRWALRFDEFYKKGDDKKAEWALQLANERLDALAKGEAPWTKDRGLLVLGYRSDIDGSLQPYGLEVPEKLDLSKPVPLYIWLHGRGDSATDLHMLNSWAHRSGQIHPDNALTLQPLGRQCIGYKSAGEIDVLDAIADVSKRYKVDPDRIVLAGFSMGGAGAWHMGAHYNDHFCAVHAGAGFVDVRRYQGVDPATVPDYEVKLWGLYDVPDYVRNLFNSPFIAYSGEIDKQKASADIMEEEFKKEGHTLTRLIGPKMGHKYDPESLKTVTKMLGDIAAKGRDWNAKEVHLQTRTLRYNRMKYVWLLGMESEWSEARLDITKVSDRRVDVVTHGVTAFGLENPWGKTSMSLIAATVVKDSHPVSISVNGQAFETTTATLANKGFAARLVGGKWTDGTLVDALAGDLLPANVVKRPGLQGPIDDAFMDPFLVVIPTGTAKDARVQRWVDFELKHFLERWAGLYRGEARVKKDVDVTDDDIKMYNLIVWGTPESNRLMNRVIGDLPVGWKDGSVVRGGQKYDAATHVPLTIYPNPLNAQKYVVLNSGPTHRENHDRTNSLQNPKLGDWAIIDITQDPDGEAPGKVVEAGFFDESWKLKQ